MEQTALTKKEWNEKRDQFICALLSANKHSDWKQSISSGIGITEELYYVSETQEPRPMTEEEQKINEHLKAVLNRDHLPPQFESIWKDSLESNPQPTDNPNEQFTPSSFPPKGEELTYIAGEPNTLYTEKTLFIPANSIKEGDTLSFRAKMTSKPTDDSKTTVKIVSDVRNEVEDTRPFNPKVVEIFNEFLPKEIAPLAIEAHKETITDMPSWIDVQCDNLFQAFVWGIHLKANPSFESLFMHTDGNTITATPEQLREWFPQPYEGGEL